MTETFAALLFAHVLADFLFQTKWIAESKQRRQPGAVTLHAAIVLVLLVAALSTWHLALLALTAAHLAIDLAKTFAPGSRLWPFLADQGAHLATLLITATLLPTLWETGLWATGGWPAGLWSDPLWQPPLWAPGAMAALAGLILATRTGGFAVGLLITPYASSDLPKGLTNGGVTIGLLERGLIYLFVMVGQPAGIGFLVAAKSVLRFESTATDQRASEYVIIGTLASFGWAMTVAWATLALLMSLPSIGIPPATP